MKPKRLLLVCALLAVGLSACGQPANGANTGSNSSTGQFLTDRGASPAAQGATGNVQGSTAAGIVEKVEGNTVSLSSPMTGETTLVQLTGNTKILQQGDVQLNEIPAELQKGDQVTVAGKDEGGVFQAEFMQIGSAGALGGGPMSMPLPGSSGGDVAAGTGGSSAVGGEGAIVGTVEQVDGSKITVKTTDGKTVTVQLAANASIRKQKEVKPDALTAGNFAIAKGEQKGNSFEATEIEVLPPPGAP